MTEKKQIGIAADCVVFDKNSHLLLIKRGDDPFKGQYALPGGFVEYGETTEEAAQRELFEETGIEVMHARLLGVYSRPDRDPRGHTISVVYLMSYEGTQVPKAGDDAASAEFVADWQSHRLAFDHGEIVSDAIKLLKR